MRGDFIEDAQKVSAPNFANLIGSETSLQHRADNGVVEAGGLVLGCMIGALADAWTWAGIVRRHDADWGECQQFVPDLIREAAPVMAHSERLLYCSLFSGRNSDRQT
jgi:hypothetical protein